MPFSLTPLPPPPDPARELAALRAEVAEIRRAHDERWLDASRAQEIRALVRDVLADSDARAHWPGAGLDAASAAPSWRSPYGGGLRIGGDDGSWTLLLGVTDQVRFVYADASGSGAGGLDDNTRWGFENRRINLVFSGTVADPTISYLMMWQYDAQPDRWSDAVGTLTPVYAWIGKDLGDGWFAMIGNQNVPWDAQTSYLEGCSLTAGDYSIFNYRFGVGREPGVTLEYRAEAVRVRGGTFSQLGVQEDRWNASTNLSFAVAGRAELKWGDASWDDLEVESNFREDASCLLAGVSGAMSNGRAQNPESPPTPSVQGVTGDLTLRLPGFTLQGQGAWMRDSAGSPDLGWSAGAAAQVAWFLADRVEAFAQGCWMNTSEVPWIAQFGVNWYLHGSRLKITAKAFVPFGTGNVNGIGQLSGGLGISAAGNNASFVAQVQMMW
jgi:hypothetical protein